MVWRAERRVVREWICAAVGVGVVVEVEVGRLGLLGVERGRRAISWPILVSSSCRLLSASVRVFCSA